ncbi:hypothetical protein EOD41_04730 [Mucilaginibacter limnophilus]|uniref:Uncharacterized protein n=1 Tax=Mucilaginibacter limnophilus TaxID=1932778 RepID=A0A437MUJ7_9SPHI|nr:hypothetical protein [Mucilaginibacter limnophilus]RVU01276.1 hypothetical protein EOD41_04730 [Mucilaginibacter limnophilus]
MKEINSPTEGISEAMPIPQERKRKPYREQPRWRVAQLRTDHKLQKMQNECVEAAYHRVLQTVKQLIMKHGGDIIYERNHKFNPESYTGMHSFTSSTFYWRLDCELNYNYEVYFAFHNCPFEETVRVMMLPFPLDRTTHEHQFPQGYDIFYQTVLEVQDPIFIATLEAKAG